jgi:phage pi2 protein 07
MKKNKNIRNKKLVKNVVLGSCLLGNFACGAISLQASAPWPVLPRPSASNPNATRALFMLVMDYATEMDPRRATAFIAEVRRLISNGANIEEVRAQLEEIDMGNNMNVLRILATIFVLDPQRTPFGFGAPGQPARFEEVPPRFGTRPPPPATPFGFGAPGQPAGFGGVPPRFGAPPLPFRSVLRQVPIRELLQDPRYRQDLNTQNGNGETPLFVAVEAGNEDAMKAFLECPDLEVNIPNANGLMALHVAVELGFTGIAIRLIRDGRTNVNVPNRDGNTALHLAVQKRNVEIVQALLKHPDTNRELKNENGETAADVAERLEFWDFFSIFE